MRFSVWSIPLLLALAFPLASQPTRPSPVMNAVDPNTGRPGDILVAQGVSLGSDVVAEVYLTDGKVDFKAAILEQTSTSIKFKVPAAVKPGRFALMVLTKGAEPRLIEQPVKVIVELDTSSANP